MFTDQETYNQSLLEFLRASKSPFHGVAEMKKILDAAGFSCLRETDDWKLQEGGCYYTTRNDSSIIAFRLGSRPMQDNGIRMVGAHTDSPCLTVKPEPEINNNGYFQLGVEVYGGALLNPWFDRDLSIAGRMVYRTQDGKLKQSLVDFEEPVAVIPSLAIHLDRDANNERKINPQTDIPPILLQAEKDGNIDFRQMLANRFIDKEKADAEVLDYELYFYDTQPPAIIGLNREFIASARLDNLLSCFTGLRALLDSDSDETRLLVCNDHEEVGSASACGAQGPMLQSVLERMVPDPVERNRVIGHSLLVSADNAHGIHPNYADRHDSNHGPLLNKGPVIKVNARQRYATNSVTAALFRQCCREAAVPVQTFVSRTDMGCGSTIGPITAAEVGVPTLDVGVPTFAMHSIRELAGTADAFYLYRVLRQVYDYSGSLTVGHAEN